jgi:hypothetical protein
MIVFSSGVAAGWAGRLETPNAAKSQQIASVFMLSSLG